MSEHTHITSALAALEGFLIPGTDADVIEHYRLLPAHASDPFALVERPVIILDTETTGFDATRCALIEIAAVRMEGPATVDEFHTFVDPGAPLPAEIIELTGITDADVTGAPRPHEAVAAFARFAKGTDLVAHNASFDRDFIMRQAAPGDFSGAWIDTLALSQIALPRLNSHRLADLAAAFGTTPSTHRATDDVRALAQVWRILLAALNSMAPGLAAYIARISPDTDWALRPLFEQAGGATEGVSYSLREARSQRITDAEGSSHFDADGIPLRFAPDTDIERAFSADGIVGAMYPSYEPRISQVQMACEVQDALRDSSYRVLEAGTGVGKSMAYLLPLARAAKDNAITVGVATKTNALMDQLVYHELPRLAQSLGDLTYVALKGYEHYPCLRKLERMARNSADADTATIQMLAMLCSWADQTAWGDLDAVNLHWGGLPRLSIQASPNDCLKNRCPFFPKRCYLHGARRHAGSSDIVVTNHALLFRDIQMDNGILPPIRHWVIDEAHAAESEARRQLSHACAASELEGLLQRLASTRSGIMTAIRKQASGLEGGTMLMGVTVDIEQRVATVTSIETSLFSYVKELADASEERNSSYDCLTLWVGPELRASGPWGAVESTGRSLVDKLDGLIRRISDLISMLEQFKEALAGPQADLSNIACDLREMLEALTLVLDGTDTSYVYSAELDRNPDKVAEVLSAAKLDIGKVLAGCFYPRSHSVIYTSATLSTGSATAPFDHFIRSVGLDHLEVGRVQARQLESSYDFDSHMTILLPNDIPEPNQRGYRQALADLLLRVHVGMGGSVLTLFTNRREMETLYHMLRPALHSHGIDLVAQTRSTTAKSLRDRFLQEESLSLFALKSFWEGFDAPGDTLRCVVIPKLPFGKPSDPLAREREARDRNAWGRHALPEAVVDLKQAAGRLIRSSEDEGWLILADARLQTKNYGKTFLRAMPSTDIRTLSTAEIGALLKDGRPDGNGATPA